MLHFKLLRTIFPEKLKNVKYCNQSYILKLSFDVLLWYWMPFYYSKIDDRELNADALKLHLKLKRINKKLAILLIGYVIFFTIFWIIASKFGTLSWF